MEINNPWSMRLIIIAGIALLFMLQLSIDGSGRTITVDDDGGGDYTNIQDAINGSTDGDTIRVYQGFYEEQLNIKNSVSLIGNGSSSTIINGVNNSGVVINIRANEVNISGFSVTAGNRGIEIHSNSNRIENNDISNTSQWGISILYSNSSTIKKNNLFNNDIAIKLFGSENNVIENNTITSSNWVGISLIASHANLIMNNTISKNTYGISTGLNPKENIIRNNYFFQNIEYAINANGSYTIIDAIQNWWGDSSGPHHIINNTEATGDNSTNFTRYEPWLLAPFDLPTAIIHLIEPRIALVGESITFNGAGETSGTQLNFTWTSSIDGTLFKGNNTSITLSNLTMGNHIITLSAADDIGFASEEVSTNLLIHIIPQATINSIDPSSATEGEAVAFFGEGFDDDTNLTYIWTSSIDGILSNGSNSNVIVENLSVGNHTISLKIMDKHGIWSNASIRFIDIIAVVIPINSRPTISITSPKDGEKISGEVRIQGTASDDDGTIEQVEIVLPGESWLPITGTETWYFDWETNELANGEYSIRVRSYDGSNYSEEVNITIFVEIMDDDENESLLEEYQAIIFIGFILLILIAVVGIGLMKKGKDDKPHTVNSNQIQSQEQINSIQTPHANSQQYPQPQEYQQPQPPAQQIPPTPQQAQTGQWQCPQCSSMSALNYAFCMNCGYKR